MAVISCVRLRELAPELALGILPGPERSDAIDHLDACPGCRALVDELAQTADAVLSLAPEVDPPLGFESRVVERVGARRRRSPWYRVAAVAAVAAAAAGITAVAEGAVGSSAPVVRAALPAHSVPVSVARFTPGPGQAEGEIFVHSGNPAWVFMTVDASSGRVPPGSWVVCYLTFGDGHTERVGSFQLYDGRGSWGVALPGGTGGVRDAVIDTDSGQHLASASF